MKRFLRRAFIDTRTKTYFLVHDILAAVTIISTISIVVATMPALSAYRPVFLAVEWVAVGIFTFEYIARLIVTKPWHHYTLSFFGVIDLVSIVPTYLGLGNLTFLKSARIIRIIRLLRLIRLAKIRHLRVKDVEHVPDVVMLNISIYLMLLVGALLAFGIGFYIAEPENEIFRSIPASMWWTFKIFNADIPPVGPHTAIGETLYVLARFVGLILLGALIGIMGNIMRFYLLGEQAYRKSSR